MLKLPFSAFFKYTHNYYRYTLMFIHVLLKFYFEFSKIRDFGLGLMDIEGLYKLTSLYCECKTIFVHIQSWLQN